MIRLKISEKENELFLRIKKDNNILIENKIGIMDFYLLFYRMLDEKVEGKNISGYLNDTAITSKDFVLINLLDIDKILSTIQYKKGSILFDVINELLFDKLSLIEDEIYHPIDEIMANCINELNLDLLYQIENSNLKLIQAVMKISPRNYCMESIIETLRKLLMNMLNRIDSKKYIIFYNSEILNFDFSEYGNCYSFDVNQDFPLERYNMISHRKLTEINIDILKKQVKLLWPISYNDEIIDKNLSQYLRYYLRFRSIELVETDKIIMASILKKLWNLSQIIIYDSSILNDNIKSFLTSL